MFIEKLMYYKKDKFKVFYGGPIERKNDGVRWVMSATVEDDSYNTRAVYEIAFINCDPETAKGAHVYFTSISDMDVKFKNVLSQDYEVFSKLMNEKRKSGKSIVVRQVDVGMVFFPDIFISSNFPSRADALDQNSIKSFLSEQFGANTESAKWIYDSQRVDKIISENNELIQYEPVRIKVDIKGTPQPFSVVKMVLKNDVWKLYYIAFKGWGDLKELSNEELFVRLDSGCVSGQIYDDDTCDCLDQLHHGLHKMVTDNQKGLIIHMPTHDGRGYGTAPKAETEIYKRSGKGRVHAALEKMDTVSAAKFLYGESQQYDLRTFDGAAKILKSLGIQRVKLLTDNKTKLNALVENGIQVVREKTDTQKESCSEHLTAKKISESYFSD
jgi:GTP cyclohydrolase II